MISKLKTRSLTFLQNRNAIAILSKKFLTATLIAIATFLIAIFPHFHLGGDNPVLAAETSLPAAQIHVLPPTLARWKDTTNSGDYFSQIKPTPVGYLVWSQFPIKVYVENQDKWTNSVIEAAQEWAVYLPLEIVEQSDNADIKIVRNLPALKPSFNRSTGEFQLPRARSAETQYEFYISHLDKNAVLCHRVTIQLSPTQAGNYIKAAARHEIGHALGIWGHSPLETDALYFSQVRNPPPISQRDINTLKRVYEQPTRLGWKLVN